MIKEAIEKIVCKQDLTYDEAYQVMNEIMDGDTTAVQNAAYLAALSTKSANAETVDEISGSAAAMRNHAIRVEHGMDVLEIVGTGGDHAHSFNISTTASFIIAAAGVKVAKHGNRAASSLSGAADCYEALGINIYQDPRKCAELLRNIGQCFMFAQLYHTSMKYVGPVRKELGIRTVFNILGPLTNPAHPAYFLLGVYDEYLLEPIAHVLQSLGAKHALVAYGMDKLDEISLSAPSRIAELKNGKISRMEIAPEDYGFSRCRKEEITGGTPQENAKITLDILNGVESPRTDIVLLNAGAAIYAGERAASIAEGVQIARDILKSGAALRQFEAMRTQSNIA
ncbi:MAG: anthranilate phosphoribosyltransferase [Mailhella sp.]|nr:anthranilate phosphoribosyltransferase [Mailhella sp.]